MLRAGKVPFYEPGLSELLARCSLPGGTAHVTLNFSMPDTASLGDVDVVLLAVGTPTSDDGHSADLSALTLAAEHAAGRMRPGSVLVVKSTSPVGTGDAISRLVQNLTPGGGVWVASNPEFLREGHAVEDFLRPARIVIGTDAAAAADILRRLYAPLLSQGTPWVSTTRRTAELVKYASNAFLATKLAFINEMANLCESLDADVESVSRGMGLDPRIGAQYLRPGPGHGGSCLPKDILALAHTACQYGQRLDLVDTVIRLNGKRQQEMLAKVRAACAGSLEGRTVGILGLAFKAETDDVREAPALALIRGLVAEGAQVRATDPEAGPNAVRVLPALRLATDAYACAADADVLVLVTDWGEYLRLDLPRLAARMRTARLVDLRNAIDAHAARAAGFQYTCVGRADSPVAVSQKSARAFSGAADDFAVCENGRRLYVLPSDDRGKRLISSHGNFNPRTLAAWRLLAAGEWTHVLDVGANYGEMLLNLTWNPTTQLVAFEPNAAIVPLLRRSLQEAGVEAMLRPVALAGRTGVRSMTIDLTWSGLTHLDGDLRQSDHGHALQQVLTPVTTLAQELRRHGRTDALRVLLKIDVEGAEREVLEGAGDVLDSLEDFAALVEVAHLNDETLRWLAGRFQLEVFDPLTEKLIPVHGDGDRLRRLLQGGVVYGQDIVLRRRATS